MTPRRGLAHLVEPARPPAPTTDAVDGADEQVRRRASASSRSSPPGRRRALAIKPVSRRANSGPPRAPLRARPAPPGTARRSGRRPPASASRVPSTGRPDPVVRGPLRRRAGVAGEQLLDPVQDRAPLPVRGLVGADLLELGRRQPVEALDHLRRRQAVVSGDGERRRRAEPLGRRSPSHTDGRRGVAARRPPARAAGRRRAGSPTAATAAPGAVSAAPSALGAGRRRAAPRRACGVVATAAVSARLRDDRATARAGAGPSARRTGPTSRAVCT